MSSKRKSIILVSLSLCLAFLLSGCKAIIFDPKGSIALSERDLIIISTLLMLIVVLPVFFMTGYFAWRYRANNPKKATYLPDWCHSNKIEFVMWSIPIIIILILAIITWISTHKLDPYRPLDIPGKPLKVQAVALRWNWLFIYPDQGIATINYLQIPVGRSISFDITSDGPMNSLMIPQIGGQIYAMPGMRSKLYLVANHEGRYFGSGVSYAGSGFSGMYFNADAVSKADFHQWVNHMKTLNNPLNVEVYNVINKPTLDHSVVKYSSVTAGLFNNIMDQFMMPGMRDQYGNLVVPKAMMMSR